MGMIKPSDNVIFADENVKAAWKKLEIEDPELYKHLIRAKEDIMKNAFCGIQLSRDLMPKDWIQKYKIKNLWKYNLPNAWRLLYSITPVSKVEIISVFLEWMNHKNYERKFNY
jgi:hypothetical protein